MIIGPLGSHHTEHKRILDRSLGVDESNSKMASKMAQAKKEQVADEQQAQIDALLAATYSNLAMANINLKRFPQSLDACEIALLYSPNNHKVIYRRALANQMMRRTDEARADYEWLLREVPGHPEAAQRLAEVEAEERRMVDQQRAAMRKMFE